MALNYTILNIWRHGFAWLYRERYTRSAMSPSFGKESNYMTKICHHNRDAMYLGGLFKILWHLWLLPLRFHVYYIEYWYTQKMRLIHLQANMEQRDLTDICSHSHPERRQPPFTITTIFNGLSHTHPPVALRYVGVDGSWIKEQRDK